MNNLTPGYLLPFVMIGTLATVAAVLFGLHRALKLADRDVLARRVVELRVAGSVRDRLASPCGNEHIEVGRPGLELESRRSARGADRADGRA